LNKSASPTAYSALPSALATLALAAATWFVAVAPASAADTSPPPASAPDPLGPARVLIEQGRWRDAIAALQSLNDTGSADWNNLMGYSHRRAKTPDLAAAENHYNAALRIDPRHRGALEYSGELYLMLGNLGKAEERLAALDRACTFGCDELRDLRQAMKAYKANGNKYVAKP
jgi:tetratricopeptide (TPR) repeat protein